MLCSLAVFFSKKTQFFFVRVLNLRKIGIKVPFYTLFWSFLKFSGIELDLGDIFERGQFIIYVFSDFFHRN